MTRPRVPPGILCSLITPLSEDEGPDGPALARLVDAQVASGVHGLFVLGTAGEGMLLSPEERKRVLELVVEAAGGRIPVVVHCGAPDTRTARDLAAHAAALGVAGIATIAPYYFRYEPAHLFEHFRAVAEAAPEVDHYVYDNPERVGYSVGVEVVTRLVREVANVRGVKDTGDSIGRITTYVAGPGARPEVYVGNNLIILPGLVIGARGAVSALANAVPELVVRVFDLWRGGHLDEARQAQLLLARLQSLLAGMPLVASVKHLVALRGLPAGRPRAPQSPLDPEGAARLEERLAADEELRSWLGPVG